MSRRGVAGAIGDAPFETTRVRVEAALAAWRAQAAAAVQLLPPVKGEQERAGRVALRDAQAAMSRHDAECRAIYRIALRTRTSIQDLTLDDVIECGAVCVYFTVAPEASR